MIDRIVLPVFDFTKARKFHEMVLSTISASLISDLSGADIKGASFWQDDKPYV